MLLALTAFVALLAISGPVLNAFYRIGYVFIDHETFPGFARLLFYGLMLPNALAGAGCLAWVLARDGLPLGGRVLLGVCAVLGLFILLINLVSGRITKNEAFKARLPVWRFRFTLPPLVLDVGTGDYAVIFAASRRCQGFVTYTMDGAEQTAYSLDAGVRRAGKLHCVLIPRDALENNRYQIHARRVLEQISYGGRLGKTIHGDVVSFRGDRTLENPAVLALSDWHFRGDKEMARAVRLFRTAPDLLLLLGDGADYSVNEAGMIRHLLLPPARLSGGEIPAIFVRGNHEVRANYDIGDLVRKIGLPSYYYQVERGRFLFTVADSAESPDGKDDWEHKDCYDMGTYLDRELMWLEALPPRLEKYNIVLCHDRDFCTETDGRRSRYFAAMARLGVRLGVSGHSHSLKWSETAAAYPNLEDGGRFARKEPKSILDIFTRCVYGYRAAMLHFDGDTVRMESQEV
ncbi:MAG: metallophosphoesterase [Oscillospiraceae bacterium]|jgi:predicted phosphodiesterase|nr:metallophosphoesterase [Oscillospiraceae bacterium]